MQSEDLDAINHYFDTTQAVTAEAVKLKDDWIRWYNGLSWWARTVTQSTYDEARNRRNAFNLANAHSPEEKAKVETVIKTGLSTEQLQGDADRRLSSGKYETPPPPLIPTEYKIIGAIFGIAALAGLTLKKIYIDPWLPRRR